MYIHKISPWANAYVFDNIDAYLTSVFTIEKQSKIYLIDTYCGPDSMLPILGTLRNKLAEKELVVVNTHFHWDHVWGNCCFKDKRIISHELCRELLDESWGTQISDNSKYIMGDVEKHLPDTTFKDRLFFHNDGVELFYSPGHTRDCISIFDHEDKVLYVGDNLEKPIVYVESEDIETYINTLEKYLTYCPNKITASHTVDLTEKDLFDTIRYLKALRAGEEVRFESEYAKEIHRQNLNVVNKRFSG